MNRLALIAVLILASCAKRGGDEQVTPTPAEPVATTVTPIEQGPASKFKGMPVQKPVHLPQPQKDPAPAASSAPPSAK